MPKEKENVEYQNVTIRIPKDLYAEYKQTLREKGAIVTYDIRNYMKEVIEREEKKR